MSSQQSERYIILDDEDPSIIYSGPGWLRDGGQDNVGVQGPPYLHTLHGTTRDGSITVQFNGTLPKAFGSFYQQSPLTPGAHNWQCLIDGVGFGHPPPPSGNISGNNYLICDGTKFALTEGVHNLTIDITITSKNSTFWLDWIQYLPSRDLPLDNTVILVNQDDPVIRYDESWQQSTGLLSMTTTPGSAVTINFIGESASWYTNYSPVELFLAPATGSYSLDGGEPIEFSWQASQDINWTNELLFTTPKVRQGSHNLTVTFLSGNSPLALDYLLIQSGNTSLPTPTAKPGASGGDTKRTSIIIGVIGGFLTLVIMAIGFYYWRRHYIRRTYHRYLNDGMPVWHDNLMNGAGAQNHGTSLAQRLDEKLKRYESNSSQSERSFGPNHTSDIEYPGPVLRHEDSGLRALPAVEELPPFYTPT